MSLQATLKTHMKEAMKAREKERLGTIRLLIAALKNESISLGRDLTEEEEISFLATQAKRRRDSIQAYREGDRDELAEQEESELAVIEGYLPKQLSEEEVAELVAEAIAQVGASSKKDMGKVMKVVMPQVRGRFPGKNVKPLVDAALS